MKKFLIFMGCLGLAILIFIGLYMIFFSWDSFRESKYFYITKYYSGCTPTIDCSSGTRYFTNDPKKMLNFKCTKNSLENIRQNLDLSFDDLENVDTVTLKSTDSRKSIFGDRNTSDYYISYKGKNISYHFKGNTTYSGSQESVSRVMNLIAILDKSQCFK